MLQTTTILLLLSFLLNPPQSLSILTPTDYLALQSIRKSLSDLPNSSFLSSWDFTSDPCSFPGVLCLHSRVISLSLGDPRPSSAGLSGHLPPTISHLSALSSLSLVPGRVSGNIPASISLLPSLRFLALSRNLFSGPIPPSLSSLPHLRVLDLSFNFLSGKIPPPLLQLSSLSTLILAGNRLSGQIPAIVKSPLIRLDLKQNRLSGPIPGTLPPSLRYLSLSYNQLSGHIDRIIPSLRCLTFLDLSYNGFSGGVPGSVFALPINSLRLQRNNFSGELRLFDGLVRIPYIDLSFNRFSGGVPAGLAGGRWIYLDYNRFRGEVPREFAEGVSEGGIRVLYLQHNFLTGMGMGIGGWKKIPEVASVCLQFNCMVPPVETACPARSGQQKTRPPEQCAVGHK